MKINQICRPIYGAATRGFTEEENFSHNGNYDFGIQEHIDLGIMISSELSHAFLDM